MIKYFGIAHNETECQSLTKLAQLELKRLQSEHREQSSSLDLPSIVETARIIEGFHEIFGGLFDRFNLSSIFFKIRYKQLKDVVIARLAEPASKLRTSKILQRDYHKPLSEDQIYRLMDQIFEKQDVIKAKVFQVTRLLSQSKVNLLLYDVTTLYFESQKADDLRDFGYSKDHKVGETQIVLALATTSEGLPIGYNLFSGKTAEVSTLIISLETWRKEMEIGEVTVVADRGMMSDDNLLKMEEAQYKYVVAAKLKQLPAQLKKEILKRHEEKAAVVEGEIFSIQEHKHKGRRLVVTYSESRAAKDRGDRERLLEKLREKLKNDEINTRKLVTNRGYLKFTNEKKSGQVILNEDKIVEDSKWDGLHGLITNDTEATPSELISRYRRLWVIEESFRLNKHTLAMRPIYHFKSERIKAHVLICYLAFALSRYLQLQMKHFDVKMSMEEVRDELLQVEASILKDKTGQLYKVPSKIGKNGEKIYRAMGIVRSSSLIRIEDNIRLAV